MTDLKKLKGLVADGEMSRREFMSYAVAAGVTVTAAGAMYSSAAGAGPKKGGHFKIGIASGSTTDTLDPGQSSNNHTQNLGYAYHNYLTEVDEKGAVRPELAEKIEASDDAAQWVVHLRKGIEFHNGKTMDADDVVASFNHHRGEDTKSKAKGVTDPITDIRTDGGDRVIFTLKEGNASFPFILSDYHIPVMPAKDGKVDAASGVGAGGYIIEKYEPGVGAVLKRNPNYWKQDRAHFDSVEIIPIKDVVARTNALTSGEIHAMNRCDLKTVHLLRRNKALRVQQVTGTQHYSVPMITTRKPYDDNNVRLALKFAVDREALVKTILRGHGEVANDHPISPANKYFNRDLKQRTYDPDRARFHMKKAGVDSLTLNLSAAEAAFGGAVDTAVLYREHAARAGIGINVIRESNDGYWSNVWMKKPWSMCYWGGRPTEDWMFSIAYARGASWNDTFWEHDRFNELLTSARSELNEDRAREMYHEMQQIVSDEGGVVIPMYASYVFALSARIAHGDIAANLELDGNKSAERWWFA